MYCSKLSILCQALVCEISGILNGQTLYLTMLSENNEVVESPVDMYILCLYKLTDPFTQSRRQVWLYMRLK